MRFTTRLAITVAILTAAPLAADQGTATATATASKAPDPHAQMHMRGAEVMGFDQEKTSHHFLLYADGGAIDVAVNDKAEGREEMMALRDAIRQHLPHIAKLFGSGDFSAPMLVHETDVPGTKELAKLKDKVVYTYADTDRGGRVDITTSDPTAVAALYKFLRFQISDHKTGDSGKIETRK